ncbi:MAG: hypothetical protein HFG10_03095 [Oscillibacter sp.]|jgi:hypothetical protein|nr:hypothetical protein [Oscillibacter sp.]
MDFFKHLRRRKAGVHPHQIIFERENTENTYITWEDKMKPRIDLDDGITQEEHLALASRWDEMLSLAEEIIWRNYLNPKSDDLMSEVNSFPDIRFLTGDYYVGDVSYGYIYRDKKYQAYHIKEGRLRHKHHNGKEWVSEWLPLDSPEITRYYQILLSLRLTGDEGGEEDDYMGLDLEAEFLKLDDPLEFEILSHDVI